MRFVLLHVYGVCVCVYFLSLAFNRHYFIHCMLLLLLLLLLPKPKHTRDACVCE